MNEINILILVSTAVLLLALWIIVGVRHLTYLQKEIGGQWELLDEQLRKRHNLLPNLIETVRMYVKDQEPLLEKLIIDRMNAAREYFAGAKKIEMEHEFSTGVGRIFNLGAADAGLEKDTNFLELRKEIYDIGRDLDLKSGKYNEMVRYYNRHRNMAILRPIASIWKFGVMNIFEVEG